MEKKRFHRRIVLRKKKFHEVGDVAGPKVYEELFKKLEETLKSKGKLASSCKYRLPVFPLENVTRIVCFEEAPGHRVYTNPNTDEVYDDRNAIDFVCKPDTYVVAAASGVVVNVKVVERTWDKHELPPEDYLSFDELEGTRVVLRHECKSKEEFTVYAHLSDILVETGKEVGVGEVIGKVGYTGWCPRPRNGEYYPLHWAVLSFVHPEESGNRSYRTLIPRLEYVD